MIEVVRHIVLSHRIGDDAGNRRDESGRIDGGPGAAGDAEFVDCAVNIDDEIGTTEGDCQRRTPSGSIGWQGHSSKKSTLPGRKRSG